MVEAARARIGRYHVLGRLAQGGMAEVYKVKTVGIAGFEKVQALKRILPHQAKEPRFIRSFVDEARIAVELSHRNIVQVFDFGEADGDLYLAMELIEGKDLRTAQVEAAAYALPLPANLAAYVIAEIGAGLDYAHRKVDGMGGSLGIVHCDVSPANVMLSTEGYVKILDFGVARASFASAVERRRLRGKPRYMAPEQTYGETPTPATDVFALGIVAWELLTGAPLFDGADLKSILHAVRRGQAPRVDRLAPDVPDELVAAVARALVLEPLERGTAADLAGAAAATAAGAGPRALAAWLDELNRRGAVPEPFTDAAPGPAVIELTSDTVTRAPPEPPAVAEPAATTRLRRRLTAPAPDEDLPTRVHGAAVTSTTAAALRELAALEVAMHEPTRLELPSFMWEGMDVDAADERLVPGLASSLGAVAAIMTGAGTGSGVGTGTGLDLGTGPRRGSGLIGLASLDESTELPAAAWTGDLTHAGPGYLESIDDPAPLARVPRLPEHRRAVIVAAAIDGPPEVTARLAQTLGELAYRRGGLVVADDPVVAFGLETASEEDAATALAFALDAQLAAREARGPVVRIGARAGVTIGGLLGGGLARPRVPADALDEARALAREAPPERPLLSGPPGRLATASFHLREQPAPRRLHRRHRAVEVAGRRTVDERARLLVRRGGFVGRAGELAALTAIFERAVAGRVRRTALVRGRAGAGKSRLLAELRARMSAAGVLVVAAAASPGSRLEPFGLAVELGLALCDVPAERGREARGRAGQRLARVLERSGLPLASAAQAIDAFATAMELRDGQAPATPPPDELRGQLVACLTAVATAEHPGRPRLIVIEDLHLADPASLPVVHAWAAGAADRGELIVMTARSHHPGGAVDLAIELGELDGTDADALAADRLADAASAETIAAVLARAGRLPLLIEEVAAAVHDGVAEIPPAARDAIAAQAALLEPGARLVLQHAAVAGEPVRASILAELLGAGELTAELAALCERGLFAREGGAPDAPVGFACGLVREAIYDALSPRARRDAHARVGRVHAGRFHLHRDEPPAAIAAHLELGGDRAGAAAFWLRAARDAIATRDLTGALGHLDRTLALEAELGGPPPSAASAARRWEARLGREAIYRARGDLDTHAEDLDELAALAGDDRVGLAEVAVRRAARLVRRGAASGDAASTDAVACADLAGDDRLRGGALIVRCVAAGQRARFGEARATLAQATAIGRGPAGDDPAAALAMAQLQLWRGAVDGARDTAGRVMTALERGGDPELERAARRLLAHVQLCLGDYLDAAAHATRARELDDRVGDRLGRCESIAVAAAIAAHVGRFGDAAAGFAAALEPGPGPSWARAQALVWAGEAELGRGTGGARARFTEALELARDLRAPYLEARALTGLAGAALGVDDAGAVEHATRGLELATNLELGAIAALAAARRAHAAHALGLAAVAESASAAALARPEACLLDTPCEEVWLRIADVCADRDPAHATALRDQARASVHAKLRRVGDAAAAAALRAMPLYRGLLP